MNATVAQVLKSKNGHEIRIKRESDENIKRITVD